MPDTVYIILHEFADGDFCDAHEFRGVYSNRTDADDAAQSVKINGGTLRIHEVPLNQTVRLLEDE